jgi:hypothetical protein
MTQLNIIQDPAELKQFISWLPDLQDGEKFYGCLFARKKYCAEIGRIKTDKAQLKRFTATKKDLYAKIRQLACSSDAYEQPNGDPYPEESLALYLMPNPRSMEKAGKETLIKMADLITKPYNGWNPQQEAMSQIQKAKSRTVFVDFDFDSVELDDHRDNILRSVNREAVSVVKTRGGFHLLIDVNKVSSDHKYWYQGLKSLVHDVDGDCLLPVPGCLQGGFSPRFLEI